MKTSMYVTELSFIKKRLSEGATTEVTPVIDPSKDTGPDPGPDPTTNKKEKPAPDSSIKPTEKPKPVENKPKSKSDVEQQAFIGGVLSDVGSQLVQKVYGVVSGDIFHKSQGRVGNNPAYTGAGTGR